MNNLGKANVKVEILDGLYGIDKEATKYNFDITAYQWDTMQNSPFFPPEFADYLIDPQDGFAAIFPSKRVKYINNFLRYSGGGGPAATTAPTQAYITWSPTFAKDGIVADLFSPQVTDTLPVPYSDYTLIQPRLNVQYPSDYIGPQWIQSYQPKKAPTNDAQAVKRFLTYLGLLSAAGTWSTVAEEDDLHGRGWINQHNVRDGLWWGVESNAFLQENMPFWVNLNIFHTPSTSNHETQFIISLGIDNDEQAYDIVLSQNNKPYIVDYYKGRYSKTTTPPSSPTNPSPDTPGSTITGVPYVQKIFDEDLSRVLDTQEDINIGIMTCAGRIIIWVNQVPLYYTRINKTSDDTNGNIKECKIGAGRIRIYGTNVQSIINVSPMTFAPLAALALPMPSVINNAEASPVVITYKGVKYNGVLEGSVAVLPQQPDKPGKLYGVDSRSFTDPTGVVSPTGMGFHRQGGIFFFDAGSVGITNLPDTSFYVLIFRSEDMVLKTPSGLTFPIRNGGCPYFFRLKGGFNLPKIYTPPSVTQIPEVISASETTSAPDYFHALSNASVTIYNKGGKYDYLRNKQYGIRISWGWMKNVQKTFIGVIVSTSSSEVAGKETLTLQCEDYMFILKNTYIVNSPFYDGMVAKYAIMDLAKRGGITQFDDTKFITPTDYFLPSGYTFSKPAIRFPAKNTIFQCIQDLAKRFEAFVYFDQDGKLNLMRLPGGLFSVVSVATPPVGFFQRKPTATNPSTIILNEKNVEYNFASTLNKINIFTLDRDTRNAILYTTSAGSAGNPADHLQFRKLMLYDQPALGELEVARKWAHDFAQRAFYPIRKTSFSTIGSIGGTINKILEFIQVDGMEYRLMSISKKYSADSNDFTIEASAEWTGGA